MQRLIALSVLLVFGSVAYADYEMSDSQKQRYRDWLRSLDTFYTGALAIAPNGCWYANGGGTRSQAKRAALRECKKNCKSNACKVVDVNGTSAFIKQRGSSSSSSTASSSKNLTWCVTSSRYNNKHVHQVTRAGCTGMAGKAFVTQSLAEAEHQRLKGATTASSSKNLIWCVTSSSYNNKYVHQVTRAGCASMAGKAFVIQSLAEAEHQRLKETVTTSDDWIWCATEIRVSWRQRFSCIDALKGKAFNNKSLAEAEHQRLKEASTPVVKTATLTLRSNVKGDRVYIDGNFKGSTRLALELPKGQHTIRIEKDGYEPYEETVNLTDNLTIRGNLTKVVEQPAQTAPVQAASVDNTAEIEFWKSIKDSDDPDMYRVYIDQFPAGVYTALAKLKIKKLGGSSSVTPSSIPDLAYGDYYALVIGNNDYQQLSPLRTAINDARTVSTLLEVEYGFNVKLLENATRVDIVKSISILRSQVGNQDNLLIYYAGHGHLDEAANEGYWLPIDASRDDPSNWITTDQIVGQIRGMQAKHVMVVADSCFSGTMTRAIKIEQRTPDYLERIVKTKSRTVLTSGGLEPVMDAGGGSHSVFAEAFITLLAGNTDILDASQLFSQLRPKVMVNSDQTPEYGDIRKAGHDGGDFLFVRH